MFEGFEYFSDVFQGFHLGALPLRGFGYWTSMFSSGYPVLMRYSRIFSRWSPWSIMRPFFAVPPQAQKPFNF